MEKQNKIFQPKVIIGSIASFIVAALGIIAVFFPNLLNLERSSMSEGQFLLSDDKKTHEKLWQFLEDNQGKVIKLEIAYCADFERMTFAGVKENGDIRHSTLVEFRAIDYIPKWFFGYGGKKNWDTYGHSEYLEKFAKQNKLKLAYYEGLGEDLALLKRYNDKQDGFYNYFVVKESYDMVRKADFYELVKSVEPFKKVPRPPVIQGDIASFTTYQYGQDIYPNVTGVNIQNGGIGFAFDYELNGYKEYKAKDILISYPSNKNKKYIWVVGFENVWANYLDKTSSLVKKAKKSCKIQQFMQDKLDEYDVKDDLLKGWGGLSLGYIKGTFYIHEKENEDKVGLWRELEERGMIESNDYSREKFELEPFDKKDMELRKY